MTSVEIIKHKLYGGAEARNLELLIDLSDWLINQSTVGWMINGDTQRIQNIEQGYRF